MGLLTWEILNDEKLFKEYLVNLKLRIKEIYGLQQSIDEVAERIFILKSIGYHRRGSGASTVYLTLSMSEQIETTLICDCCERRERVVFGFEADYVSGDPDMNLCGKCADIFTTTD